MLINNLFYEIIQLWIVDWSEKKKSRKFSQEQETKQLL